MNIKFLEHGFHGMIVNVPGSEKTSDQLPRRFLESEISQSQLFRKTSFKKPYLYETIRLSVVLEATRFLTTTEFLKQEKIVESEA